MIKLEFQNAVVKDVGYGLEVNGRSLEEIISIALGTRIKSRYGYGSGLPEFNSSCCDITVIIDPKPETTRIYDDDFEYESVEDMEDVRYEQFTTKNAETDPEE